MPVLHTFVPVPGQIFQQLAGQRLTFQCESECTHCADQHLSGNIQEKKFQLRITLNNMTCPLKNTLVMLLDMT